MSTVVVLAPLIIANWPVITTAVAAAVGTMGFAVVRGDGRCVRQNRSHVRKSMWKTAKSCRP